MRFNIRRSGPCGHGSGSGGILLWLMLLASVLFQPAAAFAEDPPATRGTSAGAKAAVVSTLTTRDLVGVAGKEAVVLTVDYPPGGSSPPHRHDANVFVYVLQGTLLMQVEGQQQVTLKAGQTFYEGPRDVHVVSANASKTEPAKFLVFIVKDKDAPVGRPAGVSH